MNSLNYLIIAITNLLIGFYLGNKLYISTAKEAKKRIGKAKTIITGQAKKLTTPPSGIIYRPSAEKLNRQKRAVNQKDVKEAFDETLGNIPEIQEARRRLKR